MIELILAALAFILASGFFAMIDAAVLSVTPAEVEVMIAKKRWGSNELKLLLRHTTRAIIVIVILTNVTNILGPILVGRKAEQLYGSEAIGVVTAILTFATIIFSEVIPKSLGAHHAPRISRYAAPFLRALVVVLFPIVFALEKTVKLFKSGKKRKVGTEEQIRALANLGGGAGHIDADERELIHRTFVLNDRTAKEVMTSANKMVTTRKNTSILQAARMVFDHNFSRYPIIGTSVNEILGYVTSKDVLDALADGLGHEPVSTIRRKLPSVRSDMRCDDLLSFLRENGAQMAVVTDEKATVGLVTLEDVLEQLVGEIKDEDDATVTHSEQSSPR